MKRCVRGQIRHLLQLVSLAAHGGRKGCLCLASERGHIEDYQGANMALDAFVAAPIAVEDLDSAR